jgi:hypothetical protein
MITTFLAALLILGLAAAYILTVWFTKDTIVDYCQYSKFLRWLFSIDEYLEISKDDPEMRYYKFLAQYKTNKFIGTAISCPVCLSMWLGVFLNSAVFFPYIILNPTVFSLLVGLMIFPGYLATAFVGLFLYQVLIKISSNGN